MELTVKFGIWNIAKTEKNTLASLRQAGYSPLTARVLCSRGYTTPEQAHQFLSASGPMPDPMELKDMDKAAARLQKALRQG